MDIAWKEDRLLSAQRSWRVVFSDGVMRIRGTRFDQKSERWVVEVDAAIRPEDVLSVKFIDKGDSNFPRQYSLEMKYRSPRDGSKAKIEWHLQYLDAETLGALLGGLEGFIESSTQRNVSDFQMYALSNYSSRAEESAQQAADERRKDEDFEARQGAVSNMVGRGWLDELGCDEQKLSALLSGTSFHAGISVMNVLAVFLAVCFVFLDLQDMYILSIIACTMLTALALVLVWLDKRSKKLSWRIKGQRVILCSDGVMLLANDREGGEVRCWYTEGYSLPLRITRIDGYKAKRRRVVLRGSFSEGRVDPASGSFVPAGDGTRVDKLEIYRIYSDEDERRLLDELDALVVRSVDQPW